LAFDLFLRLPALGEAMLAGRLDLHRAKAFIEWTEGLTDTQANQVCMELIPTAMTVVVGELVDQIKRGCLAIDPDWAEKKYKEAVKTRRVRGYRNADGTGTLGGYSQPIDRVAAACQRINSLARACKRAGDRRGIDLIRSDLYLRMLDGTFEAMTDRQIVDHVRANPLRDPTEVDDDGSGSGPDAEEPGDSGPDDPPPQALGPMPTPPMAPPRAAPATTAPTPMTATLTALPQAAKPMAPPQVAPTMWATAQVGAWPRKRRQDQRGQRRGKRHGQLRGRRRPAVRPSPSCGCN
jgi:hypothetical protein